MAQDPKAFPFMFVMDGPWPGGCDSFSYITDVAQGSYHWAVNTLARAGLVQTRPGRRKLFSLQGRNAQGFATFRDTPGTWYLVWAIDGLIYYSNYPSTTFQRLEGVTFNPFAPRVYFETGIQAAAYDNQSNLMFVSATRLLFMQDGESSPAWWQGIGNTPLQPAVVPRIVNPGPGYIPTIPVGTAMRYVDNRMWVSNGPKVYASDLLIPQNFLEGSYLATSDGFYFVDDVLAMEPAPQDTGMWVATIQSLNVLQTNIQARNLWSQTPNFQYQFSSEFGVAGPRGITTQHGLTWLFSTKGLLSINNALNIYHTNLILTQDAEMTRSKNHLNPDLSGVALGTYENILLCAVPHQNKYNRHIWIQDGGIAALLNSQIPPEWTGIWTGTWTLQFARMIQNGIERLFEMAYSSGTVDDQSDNPCLIHIWEDFQPRQQDANLGPIACKFESKALYMSPAHEYFQCQFLELELSGIRGTVILTPYITGIGGSYVQLGQPITLVSNIGPFGDPTNATLYYGFANHLDTMLQNWRPQVRFLRTPIGNVPGQNTVQVPSAHMIETPFRDLVDKGFQILLEWKGIMGVHAIKLYYQAYSENRIGTQWKAETGPNIIVDSSIT
jgi:hypothetical protein